MFTMASHLLVTEQLLHSFYLQKILRVFGRYRRTALRPAIMKTSPLAVHCTARNFVHVSLQNNASQLLHRLPVQQRSEAIS